MIMTQRDGMTIIKADKGKWLQKGESYSNTDIYLGKTDKPENWVEVDTEPVPPEEIGPESVIAEMEEIAQ